MTDAAFIFLSIFDPQALAIVFSFAVVSGLLWLGAAISDRLGRGQ